MRRLYILGIVVLWAACFIYLFFNGHTDQPAIQPADTTENDSVFVIENGHVFVKLDAKVVRVCHLACNTVLEKETSWDDCSIWFFDETNGEFCITVARKPFFFGSIRHLKIVDDKVMEYEYGL